MENPAEYQYAKASCDRTVRWLKRCKAELSRLKGEGLAVNPHQLLFGINQGGTFAAPGQQIGQCSGCSRFPAAAFFIINSDNFRHKKHPFSQSYSIVHLTVYDNFRLIREGRWARV